MAPASADELHAALERLRRRRPLPQGALGELVVTGTGFYGEARQAIRQLAALGGVTYSGDLVRFGQQRTTHLVLRSGGAAAAEAAAAGGKVDKAAEWGVPVVRLGWLVDSIAAAQVQPVEHYLVPLSQAGAGCRSNAADLAGEAGPLQHRNSGAAPSCRQLPQRPRPSGVACNAPGGAPADAAQPLASSGMRRARGQPRQVQQAPHAEQHAHSARPALAPVANRLADQMRRMSIGPTPHPSLQAAAAPADGAGSALRQQQQQQQGARPALPQPSDSPPLQRSPSPRGSPQRSLSMRALAAPGDGRDTPAEAAASGASPPAAEAAERSQAPAGHSVWQPQRRSPSPPFSPMLQSPAAMAVDLGQNQPQQQLASPAQQQRQQQLQALPAVAGGMGAVPFRLSLGRTTDSDDLPAGSPMAPGSPMADSPAAAAAHMAGMGGGSTLRRACSRLASGTPCSSQGSQEPMCTLPTPACIRDWSDDDSPGCSRTPPAAGSEPEGITQTPPDVKQALAAASGPTQRPLRTQQPQPPACQPQHAQRQQQQNQEEQAEPLQLAGAAAQAAAVEERMQRYRGGGAAAQEWSDAETVASDECPSAHDILTGDFPDSDMANNDLPAMPHSQEQQASLSGQQQQPGWHEQAGAAVLPLPALQQQQEQQQRRQQEQLQQQEQQQQQQQQMEPDHLLLLAREQNKQAEEAHRQPQQRRGLLQVSRSGQQQPRTAARVPATSLSLSRSAATAAAATASSGAQPSRAPRPAAFPGEQDEPMASPGVSPGASWGPAALAVSRRSGGSATSPGGSPGSIRPAAATAQQQGHVKQQQRSVREWSEESSDDDFPTPQGQRRQHGGDGLTGLTQLDPASLVIARPKPSGSLATWRSSDASAASSGGVTGIKFLQRPPRGNAVRSHHGLAGLKNVQFAEQVRVAAAGGLMLSTKDKKTAVRLQPGGLTEEEAEDDHFQPASSSSGGGRRSSQGSLGSSARRSGEAGGAQAAAAAQAAQRQRQEQPEAAGWEPQLAEPQTFYRLPDGSWWLEYCRFYTAEQAEEAAVQSGRSLALPPGFDRGCELLKAVGREHAPLGDVAGGMQVRRVKQGSTALRLRGGTAAAATGARSYFWRLAVDTDSWRVLTDRPTADFVAVE